MARLAPPRSNLLQGTLDMLIRRAFLYMPARGHQAVMWPVAEES